MIVILSPIGKDKCDSGWFAYEVLKDNEWFSFKGGVKAKLLKNKIKKCKNLAKNRIFTIFVSCMANFVYEYKFTNWER